VGAIGRGLQGLCVGFRLDQVGSIGLGFQGLGVGFRPGPTPGGEPCTRVLGFRYRIKTNPGGCGICGLNIQCWRHGSVHLDGESQGKEYALLCIATPSHASGVASSASSLNLRRANGRRPLTHLISAHLVLRLSVACIMKKLCFKPLSLPSMT
jgi:ribosomal protein L34